MTSEDSRESTDLAVPGGWEREFALTLRLQGFDGMQISDALAQVETHCAKEKLTPREAYGDPVAHASYLRPPPARRTRRSTAKVALPILGLAAGINLAFNAVVHWSDGVVISTGTLTSMVVFVAVVAVLSGLFGWVMTSAVNLASCIAGGLLLTIVLQWALPQALASLNPLMALALGLLLVALGLAVRQIRLHPIADARRS
jgi:hypothetical protein